MTDFFLGFFFAFPSAFLLSLALSYVYIKRCDSNVGYNLELIKEDLANLQVKLSGFLSHV
jgi:hypothetical protein